jgi:two-component system response regulator FixJ
MSDSRVVAVIDDDLAVLDSLKFLLEVVGYAVVAYNSAAAFLDDRVTRPACLIVDQHMPLMTGLELVSRLRQSGAYIPTLLITGASSPTIVAQATLLGLEVLEKPPTENNLLKFVDAHCAGRDR